MEQRLSHPLGVRGQLRPTAPVVGEVGDDVVGQRGLAIDAADAGRRASGADPGLPLRVGEELVQRVEVALVGVAGVVGAATLAIRSFAP